VFARGPVSIVVATNDPDRPTITIQLGKDLGGTDPDDPELTDSAAGCSAGSASGFGTLLVLGVLLIGRRRRRAA
jgi:uncharacterized protein (TIGR03382 family)